MTEKSDLVSGTNLQNDYWRVLRVGSLPRRLCTSAVAGGDFSCALSHMRLYSFACRSYLPAI
jgi:hypothetical protein